MYSGEHIGTDHRWAAIQGAYDPAVAPARPVRRNIGLQQDPRFQKRRARLFPFPISVSSCSRSSAFSRTTYFFTKISFLDMVTTSLPMLATKANHTINFNSNWLN